jgi:hypothetical protein
MVTPLNRMGEVVDHSWGEYLHVVAFAGVDKDVGLDLRHIAEETINFLRRNCAYIAPLNHIQQL